MGERGVFKMKLRKGLSFLLASLFCFCLAVLPGCWDGGNSDSGAGNQVTVSGAGNQVTVIDVKSFDPKNLPKYKELPLPSADEQSATMGLDEEQQVQTTSRKKSSNDFFNTLRDDLINSTEGEVRLDFYGPNHTSDIYGDYLGSRTLNANSFFRGIAEERIKVGEYYIHAITYSEFSGYCFDADAHVIFHANETNRVVFSFRPTGNVIIPCYIPNPAGDYLANRYDFYPVSLKADYSYVWMGPCYNEQGELEFKICCTYGDLADICDEEMELSVTATDGLHIMKFVFNPLDITKYQRPLKLIAEEIPMGNWQYGGEFDFMDGEIIVSSPADGVATPFPIRLTGSTKGLTGKVYVEFLKEGIVVDSCEIPIVINDASGVALFAIQRTISGVGVGDKITIKLSNGDEAVAVDVVIADVPIPAQGGGRSDLL